MSRLRTAFCLLVMLSGCASVRTLDVGALLESGQLPALASDEGILVVDLSTQLPIARLDISGRPALTDIEAGEHLRLLAVNAGGHRWSGLVVPAGEGEVPFRARRDAYWQFRVEPGRINYPGAITVHGVRHGKSVSLPRIGIRNRSAQMLRRLRERFPELLEQYPLTYSGQKQDAYLEYYQRTFSMPGRGAEEADSR